TQEKLGLSEELAADKQYIESFASEKALQWQAMRKAEGLYNQLREQFEQKSEILDNTRRDLFNAQEQLLNFQRDKTEKDIYNYSVEEKVLIKHIIKTERYYDQMVMALQSEIESLHSLVDTLNSQ